MTIQEAKETVILAGKRLVESGLIARTWGNVSCRISDTHFVITPSGRDYISLTPEEIVEVQISDCSYGGDVKPSSEKGVHAEVYKHFPDINFVIHTHQDYASALSVLEQGSIKVSKEYATLSGEVVCADYGLPGTKKLRKGVERALSLSKGKAVIMRHHGALCFNKDYDSTFQVASELENACKQFIKEAYLKASGKSEFDEAALGSFALSKLTKQPISPLNQDAYLPCESKRTASGFQFMVDDQVYDIAFDQMNQLSTNQTHKTEAAIHNAIYKNCSNINNILHAYHPAINSVSCSGLKQFPLLDDFAQIAGVSVGNVVMNSEQIGKALSKASVVFLRNNGALCCGATKSDEEASIIVTKKNCNALISAALFGKVKYINPLESRLMRFVYLKKYSKQVNH